MKRPAKQPTKTSSVKTGKTSAAAGKGPPIKVGPAMAKAAAKTGKGKAASPAKATPKNVSKTGPDKRPRSACPINLVLEAVGDAWSLLILRDMMLRGHSSYQAFLRSEEKIATNILADRLARLEANGLISKTPDPLDARKFIYALTDKGADLAPLLVEMTLFSNRHALKIDMPKEVVADMARNKQAFSARLVRACRPKPILRRPRPASPEPGEETLSLF